MSQASLLHPVPKPKPAYYEIHIGDCLDILMHLPKNSVDLIITSPPYTDQRKSSYGGIKTDEYVRWFLQRSALMLHILKPSGTFILNIKERAINGERCTYVLELILEMRKQGWLWTEEFIWHKKNCYPGKWPNRFRDSWERLLQFNKRRKFKMFQEGVMVPMGNWKNARLANLSENDKIRNDTNIGSGFGKNVSNWIGRNMAYPTNVLHMATECGNKKHSAVFPKSLPAWFIKLFTEENDLVLDPFVGSGTTLLAASELGRKSIGIEINPYYKTIIEERLKNR